MDSRISVVIPSYKEAAYIEKTLKALRGQSYRDIEIIVVDSDPGEETRDIARGYADKVIHLSERGVSKARNLGARNASGGIILFMDADTIIFDGSLQEIARIFEGGDVASVCGFVEVESSFLNRLIFRITAESGWLLAMLGIPLFYGFCVAYRRDVFERIGGFNESLVTCEDLDVSMRAAKAGRCVFSRKVRVVTSARRLEKGGTVRMIVFHLRNFMNYLKCGKPAEHYPVLR